MYVPAGNEVADQSVVLALVRTAGFGHLVSHDGGSFEATGLPFLVDDDLTMVRAHLARANRHWRTLDGRPVLLVVPVTDSYISPNWYPSKADDPRVVPTWNYEVVHLHGTVVVRDDTTFVERVVRDLTELHERERVTNDGSQVWSVDDAPADYIQRRLRTIVGIEVRVERVDAKRKLSQNRDDADQRGVATALGRSPRPGAIDVGRAMRDI